MGGLHFVIFGVARSGTTALEQAVNLHPGLFCAHERGLAFEPRESDALVEAVLAQPDHGNAVILRSKDTLRAKLAAGGEVAIGDKLPNYFFSLPRLARFHPRARPLLIHRDPVRVAMSWDRRARRRKDRIWDRGKFGCFALFDNAFCLLATCLQAPGARIVSHRALFHGTPALIDEVVGFLSPDGAYPHDAFAATLFDAAPPPDPAEDGAAYAAFCAESGAARVTDLIDREGFAPVASMADALVSSSIALALPSAEFVMRSVREMPLPERQAAMRFGAAWLEPYRRFLKAAPDRTDMHDAIDALHRFFLAEGVRG